LPPAEKLLPADTLFLLSTPDFRQLETLFKQSSYGRLWNDPVMKPFREKFESGWKKDVLEPLEREWRIGWADYEKLLQGQTTLALRPAPTPGEPMEFIVLVDTKDKALLTKRIAELRKKWFDTGKPIRGETVRGTEVTLIEVATNDIPNSLRKIIPRSQPVQELGAAPPPPASTRREVALARHESLLIVSSSLRNVEHVLACAAGTSAPSVAEVAAYDACHQSLLRTAPVYAWVNVARVSDTLRRQNSAEENPEAPNPFEVVKLDKIVAATGLGALTAAAFTMNLTPDGLDTRLFLAVPEADRRGVFMLLAGEPKDPRLPAFITADTAGFRRWRMDGQRAWNTLEKMLTEVSPQWFSSINFLLDTANLAARQKDPGFDVRKNLIGNLGDDFIIYTPAPRGTNTFDTTRSLWLLGSPNAEQLADALRSVLVFLNAQGGTPLEREFLGRKIYSVPIPQLPFQLGAPEPDRVLNYAASAGYVALSADAGLLEQYLRNNAGQTKSLLELPGLPEAAQRVLSPAASSFRYENDSDILRAEWESLRRAGAPETNAAASVTWPAMLGLPIAEGSYRVWMDYSLLPPYDAVARHFTFTVKAGEPTAEGWSWRAFTPAPRNAADKP
jgi:hypothetical protein